MITYINSTEVWPFIVQNHVDFISMSSAYVIDIKEERITEEPKEDSIAAPPEHQSINRKVRHFYICLWPSIYFSLCLSFSLSTLFLPPTSFPGSLAHRKRNAIDYITVSHEHHSNNRKVKHFYIFFCPSIYFSLCLSFSLSP